MPKVNAALRKPYGSPEQISVEKVSKPVPQDDEILVRVYATTVNRTDCANLTAKPFIMRFVLGLIKPRKVILGTDFAGQVVEVGKNVRSFRINDRVFGFTDTGLESQAEYLTIAPEESVLTIPDDIDYRRAAASLEGAHYAYSFVHKVNLQPKQKILINGASGAIGLALLQLVRQYDVHVTATANTENIDLIRSLGADKIYDYTKEDFTQERVQYDFVFDAVGKSTFGRCKPLLKEDGVYISSELGPYAQNIFLAAATFFRRGKKVIIPIPFSVKETLPYIKDLLTNGKFTPVIDRSYSLEDIVDAYEYVMTGKKTGNVLIDIRSA